MRARRGFSLLEVLVAVAVAAGPLTVVVGMMQAQARDAHALEHSERMSALLNDAVEVLATESPAKMARLGRPEGQGELQKMVNQLMASSSLTADSEARRGWTVRCALAGAGVPGLVRLTLTARRDTGHELVVKRLVRNRS